MIINVNGKNQRLDLRSKKRANASELHQKAVAIIKEIFPYDPICEEVYVPDIGLYLDVLLPNRMLCVEVMGAQHYSQTAFYHKNTFEFYKAQSRDRLKKQVLEDNGIELIQLRFDEEKLWKEQILLRTNSKN